MELHLLATYRPLRQKISPAFYTLLLVIYNEMSYFVLLGLHIGVVHLDRVHLDRVHLVRVHLVRVH